MTPVMLWDRVKLFLDLIYCLTSLRTIKSLAKDSVRLIVKAVTHITKEQISLFQSIFRRGKLYNSDVIDINYMDQHAVRGTRLTQQTVSRSPYVIKINQFHWNRYKLHSNRKQLSQLNEH